MAGIDWSAFSAAFMKDTAANINEKKDAAKTWEETQQALALKNVATAQKRSQLVDRANGYYQYLKDNGATNDQIQAALDTGADGIVKFADKVAQAVADRGGRKLTTQDTSTIISLPDSFRGGSLDDTAMKDYIAKVYGLGGVSKGVGESANVTLWDRMTGKGAKDIARARLDQNVMYDGYTALDLNELAQTAEYNSLNPGTMASFLDYKYATPEVVYKASDAVDTQIKDMRAGAEYAAAEKALETAQQAIGLTGTGLTPEEAEANVKAAQAKIIELNRRAAGPLAKKWLEMYGSSLDEALGENWDSLFGADYFGAQPTQPTVEPVSPVIPEIKAPPLVLPEALAPVIAPSVTDISSILEEEGAAPEVIVGEDGNQTITFIAPGNKKPLTFIVNAEGKVISAKGAGNVDFDLEVAQEYWDEKKALTAQKKAQLAETPVIGEPVIEDTPLTPLQQRLTERGADFTDDRDPAIQKSMDFVAAELENPTTNGYAIKIKGRMPTYFTSAKNLSMIPAAAIESGNVTIMDINDVSGKKQSLTQSGIKSYLKPYFDDAKAEGLMSKPAEPEAPEAPEVKLPGLKLEDAKQLKFAITKMNGGAGPNSVEDVRKALTQYAEMRKQGFIDAQDNEIKPSDTALPKTEEQLNKLAELLYTEYK